MVLCLAALLVTAPGCEAATVPPAPTPAFVDDFSGLDPARWTPGPVHRLGRSRIDPANVRVEGGALLLTLPAGTLDGAELRTVDLLPGGVARARLRVADAPGSLTGFFLYAPPDYAHEIDIEIHGDPAGRVVLSTYDGGAMPHSVEVGLPFDPTADLHDYEIATGDGGVVFRVDGRPLATWSDGVPAAPMALYLNAWYPAWLPGSPPPSPRATTVDRVSYTPARPLRPSS
jgi:beta-glucanase (GH16 family)